MILAIIATTTGLTTIACLVRSGLGFDFESAVNDAISDFARELSQG